MNSSVSEITLLWDKVLANVKTKLNDQNIFDAFFANSYVDKIEGQTLFVVANSGLAANLLKTKYLDILDRAVIDTMGTPFTLNFITEEDVEKGKPEVEAKPRFFETTRLNPNHTFKTFVVGQSNREAYQASIMAAKDPGKTFNPLMIFSDSGLGKTHLLHSIGNSIRSTYPAMRVLYCTAADFVDEYVKYASGDKEGDSLATYFKNEVDVFLVDDIQFLVGKKKTMEMFFVVFSSLYNQGKQIVITSDQHPNDLDGLDQRLKTRFVQGLTLSIKPPDLPTSEGILKARIETNGLDVNDFDDEVISFISSRFSSNVRELEEALNRLLFYTVNIKPTKHIDLAVATEAMQDLIGVQEKQSKLSDSKIIAVVADYYNITPTQITGKIRTSQIALARHICMYLMRTLLDDPFAKIGQALGGKDHATVINGVSKVEKALKTDPNMKTAIEELKSRLQK